MKKIIPVLILILSPIFVEAVQQNCEVDVLSYASLKKTKRYYCNKNNRCYSVKKNIPIFIYVNFFSEEFNQYLIFKRKELVNHCYQSKQSNRYFSADKYSSWNFIILNDLYEIAPNYPWHINTFPDYHLPFIDEKNHMSLFRFTDLDTAREINFDLNYNKSIDYVGTNRFILLSNLPKNLVYLKPDAFFKKYSNKRSSNVMILKSQKNNLIQVRIHEENKQKNTYTICNYSFIPSEDKLNINYDGVSCIIYYQYKINLNTYREVYSDQIDNYEFLKDIKK